ncbi:MAG: phosphoribosylglycinamide formyltransferase [Pseudomonadota bacterium]
MSRMRVGVLISGRGSNLAALIEACAEPAFPAEIVAVISNRPGAGGLQIAATAGIPCKTIDHTAYSDRSAFDAALDEALRAKGVELICNAGFMRLLTADFVEAWRDRQLNIHPSLLPAFKGLHTHRRALEAGVKVAGCTVHFVRAEMDEGPIVGQAAVPVRPGDTEDSLAARVLEAEHRLYPLCLRLVASGAARVIDGRVVIEDGGAPVSPYPTISV